jgi:hypothetical protein
VTAHGTPKFGKDVILSARDVILSAVKDLLFWTRQTRNRHSRSFAVG